MSDTVQQHRWQPSRRRHPWDSPGKNTGVGCHFLLQCRKVKSESEVTQSCPVLRDSMDYSPSGSSIHGIFQARVLEWGAIAFFEITNISRQIRKYFKMNENEDTTDTTYRTQLKHCLEIFAAINTYFKKKKGRKISNQ